MITNFFVSIRYKVLKIFIEINEIMIFQINQIYFLSHLLRLNLNRICSKIILKSREKG